MFIVKKSNKKRERGTGNGERGEEVDMELRIVILFKLE